MSNETIDLPKIQARFFGLNYKQAQAVVQDLSTLVERLGSTTPEGQMLIEAQGLLDDLTIYAETIRMHESVIVGAIAGTEGAPKVAQRPRPRVRNKNTVKKKRPSNKGRGGRTDS